MEPPSSADGGLVGQLIAMGVLLLLSAFFSGSETAFFSLNSLEKDALRRRATGLSGSFIRTLFSQPDEVLVTILTGNMFVNVFATSISEDLGERFFADAAELVSIVAMTITLLLIGEMTPKNVAIRHSLKFSFFSARILRLFYTVLKPVVGPLSALRHRIISSYRRLDDDTERRSAAVLSAIRMGYQSGTIQLSELHLLESFFRFKDKTAGDVMVPRIDIHPVDSSSRVSEVLTMGERLIPVYKQDVDHIVGYLRRRDIIPFRLDTTRDPRVSELTHPIHAVPETKHLRDLMDEMDELDAEVSLVVDEYGGTEGIVTHDSIVAYLFEAFFPGHESQIQAIGPGRYRVAGGTEVDSLSSVLATEFETDSRTVSGMVIDELDDLPTVDSEVEIEDHTFRVTAVRAKRIMWLEVTKNP